MHALTLTFCQRFLASHMVSLFHPKFSHGKMGVMIEDEGAGVCVSYRNCDGTAVLVMAGQLVWRVFRLGVVHCPLIAPTMTL